MEVLLFSYGTLQLKRVQQESFGRLLTGQPDMLPGYRLETVEIRDPEVLAHSEQRFHPIARYTGDPEDTIEGTLFAITEAELALADRYEVADYQRVEVVFVSGESGWVYVGATGS